MRLAAVSVDLDEVRCYSRIHGLQDDPSVARTVYDRCVARYRALFDELDIRATFFAIGEDADDAQNADILRSLQRDGHEIGNHSYSHKYDLVQLPREEMLREVRAASDSIERATGVRPVGFRAPGYTIVDPLFDVLSEQMLAYDSSVFPCPGYYTAKAVAISAIALRGRKSASIVDDPRVLLSPADPYRIGRPYWTRGNGLIELPIGVTRTRTGRLPFIGTNVMTVGAVGARMFARAISGRPLVNFELHGVDLADAREDGLEALARNQPDLRVAWTSKRTALVAACGALRDDGYKFVRLADAAVAFA